MFLNHEGDLFRTRLTHSLEVAQLGRSMARSLQLHEDLVEAIALAHDLGHTPFGHAGQDALNACMAQAGGFEHNLQSLRVVDGLEHRYPEFDGLNLCFETREGILKHCSRAHAQRLCELEPGGVAQRFLDHTSPSLEAQLCNLADSIAYNAHDIDDGVRSGLLTLEQMQEAPLFSTYLSQVLQAHPKLHEQPRRWLYEAIRRMLSDQVYDVVRATSEAIHKAPMPVLLITLERWIADVLSQQQAGVIRYYPAKSSSIVKCADKANSNKLSEFWQLLLDARRHELHALANRVQIETLLIRYQELFK